MAACMSFGSLCVSKKWFISSLFSNFGLWSCSYYSFIIFLMSVGISSHDPSLICAFSFFIFLSLWLCLCLSFWLIWLEVTNFWFLLIFSVVFLFPVSLISALIFITTIFFACSKFKLLFFFSFLKWKLRFLMFLLFWYIHSVLYIFLEVLFLLYLQVLIGCILFKIF